MIFDADMNVVAEAAGRWQQRTKIRESRQGQPIATIEDPRRIEARLSRLAEAAKQGALRAQVQASPLDSDVLRAMGMERVIGQGDFQNIAFLELALAVSRFVGRVNIRSSRTRGVGFGTGFMVSPRLLITNNHVLPQAASAQFSVVEFDYQLDRTGRQLQPVPFALQPEVFFLTDTGLDFSLVAVAERSTVDRDLKHYGWSRLLVEQGKILLGEHVNIIQHPRGQFKQFVDRANEVLDVLDDYLHYTTDTEPGSSGSPVYNDQWDVVALHHSGVPRTVDGRYVDKRGGVWDERDPEDIDWVANEGIRVSRLVQFIERQPLDGEQARLRDEMLRLEPPHPIEAAKAADERSRVVTGAAGPKRDAVQPAPDTPGEPPAGTAEPLSFTIPLRVTVQLSALGGFAQTAALVAPAIRPNDTATSAGLGAVGVGGQSRSPELMRALVELDRAATRPYYDAEADTRARQQYYQGLDPARLDPAECFRKLSELVTRSHKTELPYAPATHVYPWLDLRPGSPPTIKSIYSGKPFDARELIEADFRVAAEREQLGRTMASEATVLDRKNVDDVLEASLPYNCEHVVPQSWFGKRAPMRGDLHHLFACESGCNSFRGNTPYYDFPAFEEALRTDCGQRERQGFEPSAGKGAIARATLYFLLRYPGLIGDAPGEMTADRLPTLLQWHRRYPVDEYERHRNAVAADKQGNRNPLIDFPEWAERIDFALGVAGARPNGAGERTARGRDLASAVAAIAALDWQDARAASPPAAEISESRFGRYDGTPAHVALLSDGRKLELLAPFSYVEENGLGWPTPIGAIVDGASIPRPFWTLIGGPLEGKYRDASIIHDVYCDQKSRPWRDTHRMFYTAMRCSGVGEVKAKIMYYAVYRFGPRWELAQEALGMRQRAATDADAATVLADAEAIFAHGLDLQEIENLADARERPSTPGFVVAAEAAADPAALQRARLLVVTGGSGSAEDLEAVAREAAHLPGYVMTRFEQKKIRIIACRESVTDFEKGLRGEIPRGWEGTGRTWDDVPGTYLDEHKRVVIATVDGGSGRTVPSRESGRHGSVSLVVHESLHGYDYSGGHAVLAEPAFLQARDADLDSLDVYQRQPGQAGLEETFAESGARFVGEPAKLQQDCPHLSGYWEVRPAVLETEGFRHEFSGRMVQAEAAELEAPIGTVEQDADGTVRLHLRAEGPGGAVGHAAFELSARDVAYAPALRLLRAIDARAEASSRRESLLRPFRNDQ